MKIFLITTIAFLAISITCNAQWTLGPGNINNTNTGNVGIGTTSPIAKLEVDGPSVANGTSNALFLLNPSNTLNAGAGLIFGGPSNIYASGSIRGALYNALAGGTGKLILGSNSSGVSNDELTLFGGKVGVGTATPITLLDVVVASPKTTVAGNVASFLSTNDAANPFGLRTMIYGAAAIANRYVTLQTSDYGLVDGGSLILQPSTGYVGIGTTTPSRSLDVNGYIQTNTGTIFNNGKLWDITSNSANLFINETGIGTRLTFAAGGNVGIGTTSPDQKLTVNGTIHAKSVVVDTNIPVPDYVFNNDYNLPSLTEIKTYTDKNHHLPGVPAAAELEKNGINLGEMNMMLLKKVEELTLYLIEKDKKEKEQQKQIDLQKQRLDKNEIQLKELTSQINSLIKLVNNQQATSEVKQ
jgi:hypothetical protein